jgi:hypothetical protein
MRIDGRERRNSMALCDFQEVRPGLWRDQHGCELVERARGVILYSKRHYDAYQYHGTLEQFLAEAQAPMTALLPVGPVQGKT